MAYIDIKDRPSHVMQLQKKLRSLSRWTEDDGLNVAVDGNYDNGTEAAVRNFQTKYGLEPTGTADIETWELVDAVYRENANRFGRSRRISPFPDSAGFRVRRGERSTLVFVIQIMLNELRLYYDTYGYLPLNGKYDIATAFAVTEFQRAAGIEEHGEVDRITWNRLAEEYNLAVSEGNT